MAPNYKTQVILKIVAYLKAKYPEKLKGNKQFRVVLSNLVKNIPEIIRFNNTDLFPSIEKHLGYAWKIREKQNEGPRRSADWKQNVMWVFNSVKPEN